MKEFCLHTTDIDKMEQAETDGFSHAEEAKDKSRAKSLLFRLFLRCAGEKLGKHEKRKLGFFPGHREIRKPREKENASIHRIETFIRR